MPGLNYVRCTIVQWQRIPQSETQPEPESETGIQQIRAGMLKYCKNTEIQRAVVETKLRQQEQQLSRACSLSFSLSLALLLFIYNYTNSEGRRRQEKHTLKIFPVALTAFWPDTTHKLLFALAISRRRTTEWHSGVVQRGVEQFLPGCTAPVCQSIVLRPLAKSLLLPLLLLFFFLLTRLSVWLAVYPPSVRPSLSVVASLFLSPAFQYNFHGPPLRVGDGCSISFGSKWGKSFNEFIKFHLPCNLR